MMFINLVVIPFLYISFLKKKSKSKSRKPKPGDKDYVQPAEHYQPDFPEDQLPLDKGLQPWDYFEDNEKLCYLGEYTQEIKPYSGEEREERIERRERRIAGEKKLYARKKKEKRRQKAKEKIKQRETKDTVAAAHAKLKEAEEELRQMLLAEKEENGEQRESKSS